MDTALKNGKQEVLKRNMKKLWLIKNYEYNYFYGMIFFNLAKLEINIMILINRNSDIYVASCYLINLGYY